MVIVGAGFSGLGFAIRVGQRGNDDFVVIDRHCLFARGNRPARVARAITRAVETDRPVAMAGFEAHAGWVLHRLLPIRAVEALAGRSPS